MIEWNVYEPQVVEENDLVDVVVKVGYSVYARLDEQIVQGDFGQIKLSDPDPNSFIPMENLTKDVVIGWVKDVLGADKVAEMESKLNDLVTIHTQVVDSEPPAKEAHFIW